ncbi:hypothetical protein [Candidatus Parabeggiatoa sp. HSG14]|uniref:hypothetical protein n=1 Tax=Candidatus Parabeggiatoa sp. HSG14 TaxID=3055593 RepID=UPI0025A76004|nr:hypothetical protein [Thiotrichales bacterium HSG14]
MIDEKIEGEVQEMGSLNHSIAQTQIAGLLLNDERFRAMVELSLDASQTDLSEFGLKTKEELKPDVCLYPNTVGFSEVGDILKMSDWKKFFDKFLPKNLIWDNLSGKNIKVLYLREFNL